jgi:hypothetical protein
MSDIETLLIQNKITQETLIEVINYNILKNYGHHILNTFGSDFYDELEFNITNNYISNISQDELNKIMTHHLLKNHREIIIKKFGENYFNDKIKVYS